MRARYDQHFLIDDGVADAILAAAGIKPGDTVIEIGPGAGVLTRRILARGAALTAVEVDPKLIPGLERRFTDAENFSLLHADFLKLDLARLPRPAVVVSNLPYSVGTPILQRLLDWPGWELAVLMLQREVVDRVLSSPGSRAYGPLTLSVALKAEVEPVCEAGPECFQPPPKVSSSVMRLHRFAKIRLPDKVKEADFFRVVKAAFGQRRKMAAKSAASVLGIDRAAADAAFLACGLDPKARAETLSLDDFIALTRKLA
ncbi:MAG: ribosomal RNA small subunit methyltransferase A [Elusimicrobia bacterium CG1_02_63_36]|nr:MAG: ribosomal RNA small subunit methyltransferase A [Elusimicrobia bacterium CG1_02_63_36]PIP83126.1 MAG: ribosomal RNA small subunit methyltransferase A [Elusimicrobia bacterium CG22_combo_CG10-13_8_21_14_all_63_91]PJA17381.1 MAG: ribosomal RNA small subunit methyltransferase A [Elusimicrobia bacterium CG_4_10_14_0_2_um_filter_63_34]PJB23614.1 MAG: ribosomal RNA small subunit methyltransferase A [Elusimicrobia bacterium CG_4_9_14_3_um_filter_62_55]